MKKKLTTVLMIMIFLLGLLILLYPHISNYYNNKVGSHTIANYDETITQTSNEDIELAFKDAEYYNAELLKSNIKYILNEDENKNYMSQLVLSKGTSLMGYIEIRKIKLKLPIYHGSSSAVLQVGAGHLEWTSLPIGGVGNHTVITGHRGLPTAKLFTNLDNLVIGDKVKIKVLDRELVYQVKETFIVEPKDVELLKPVEGEDLLTLVTCTPYGVNSHRLLIRCERIEGTVDNIVLSDAKSVDSVVIAPIIFIFIILVVTILKMVFKRIFNR